MPLARADVRGVCFAHWPVDPCDLSARLPPALTAATRDGTAWVSVLAQRTKAGVRGLPLRYGFPQVALRTYVRPAEAPESAAHEDPRSHPDGAGVGVYFLAVAADTRAAAFARRAFGIPFQHASVGIDRDDDGLTVRAERQDDGVLYDATIRPTDEPTIVERGSLFDWLTERYRYYLPDGRWGEVAHAPWTLTPAEGIVRTQAIFDWADVPEPVTDPRLSYSPGTDIWLTRRP